MRRQKRVDLRQTRDALGFSCLSLAWIGGGATALLLFGFAPALDLRALPARPRPRNLRCQFGDECSGQRFLGQRANVGQWISDRAALAAVLRLAGEFIKNRLGKGWALADDLRQQRLLIGEDEVRKFQYPHHRYFTASAVVRLGWLPLWWGFFCSNHFYIGSARLRQPWLAHSFLAVWRIGAFLYGAFVHRVATKTRSRARRATASRLAWIPNVRKLRSAFSASRGEASSE